MLQSIFKEKNLFAITLLNVVIIYFHSFNYFTDYYFYFDLADACITIFFLFEIIYKISNNYDQGLKAKFKYYWNYDDWNKLDFISVVLALPSLCILFMKNDFELFAGFTVLRSLRIFKFIRVIEFIPNGKRIGPQLVKALKAVMFIIFAFIIYSIIISLISVSLYKVSAPKYFANAFMSFFTIFKIFSGDGFSDVVDHITSNNCNIYFIYFTKFYFVFIVFTGSILGLSLINSIFIDQMMHSNDKHDADEQKSLTNLKSELEEVKKQNQEIIQLLNERNKN